LKSLGHKAYRFSGRVARILPNGRGAVNGKGLDFYSRLVDGLLERGITPYVTLYTGTCRKALERPGAGATREADAFVPS